jgi:LPXTG-site transpeptidase (sortase) family protein
MEQKNRGVIGNIAAQPISFSVAFLVFLFAAIAFLGFVDALPEPSKTAAAEVNTFGFGAKNQVQATVAEDPIRITASKISMDVAVKNPSSTKVAVLDEALLSGAVRYPTSAKLGEKGTVLLFGHSSYLPVIYNQAYKAFKGIQTLEKGDAVSVYSATLEYRYTVETVSVANANEDVIELRKDGKYLTLVTCDTFAKKSDRFVVTAKFVGAYPLTSN